MKRLFLLLALCTFTFSLIAQDIDAFRKGLQGREPILTGKKAKDYISALTTILGTKLTPIKQIVDTPQEPREQYLKKEAQKILALYELDVDKNEIVEQTVEIYSIEDSYYKCFKSVQLKGSEQSKIIDADFVQWVTTRELPTQNYVVLINKYFCLAKTII